ncbi:serine/threonine-protein kinase [Myxococcus eversor]|uniref:serine/threonine-protein kinase n=1 Tax=Myxococcus eversor TaxID=2709661 RepID=UPI0013D35501|nr:serine/threonine-protein kinase [Myxococcus eversor]
MTARDKFLRNEVTPATPGTDALLATQVGDFIIDERIGSGGMGVVYRATHPLIGKQVAIKILRAELVSQQQVERLLIEARAVNAIQHPGIIDIFGFGSLPDGRPYVIMELLQGQSLAAFIRQHGCLDAETTLWILDQMLAALGAAHRAGIVHRDLKPGNVFLARASNGAYSVKLVDFGIAKLVHSHEGPTTLEGSILGTPEFMAPEQIRGAGIGPATDLYAVGVMTFQMLTGALPFQGEPLQVLFAHVEQPPPVPSARVPSVPPELDTLVLQLMAKDPGLRPESAEIVRLALRRGSETGVSPLPSNPRSPVPAADVVEREPKTVQARRLSQPPPARWGWYWLMSLPLLAGLCGVGIYLLVASPPVAASQAPSSPTPPSALPARPPPPANSATPATSLSVAEEGPPSRDFDVLPEQKAAPHEIENSVAADTPRTEPQHKPAETLKRRGTSRAKGGSSAGTLNGPGPSDAAQVLTLDEALASRSGREITAPPQALPVEVSAVMTSVPRTEVLRKEVALQTPPLPADSKSPGPSVPRAPFLARSKAPPQDANLMERVYQLEERYLRHPSPAPGFEENLKQLHAQALDASTRTEIAKASYSLSVLGKKLDAPWSPPAVLPPPPPPQPRLVAPRGPQLDTMLSLMVKSPPDAKLARRFSQYKGLFVELSARDEYPLSILEELIRLHRASMTADTATKRMDVQRGLDAWRQSLDRATPK